MGTLLNYLANPHSSMTHLRSCALVCALLPLLITALDAQNSPKKLGKADLDELRLQDCTFEPGAPAMVLFDVAESEIVVHGGGFAFEAKYHKRIKIFSKNGLEEANINIRYFAGKNSTFEQVTGIKAYCHYLENGSAKTVALPSKDVFVNDLGEGWRSATFAIPAAREGCVIEYAYRLASKDLANLDGWYFQQDIPVLYSEYVMTTPEMFVFRLVLLGTFPLSVNTSDKVLRNFSGQIGEESAYSRDRINADLWCNTTLWAMKEVPSIRHEPLMSPKSDLAAHLEFQLLMIQYPGGENQEVMSSYEKFNKTLLDSDDFGSMAKPGRFEQKLIEGIVAGVSDTIAIAEAILEHIEEKVSWDGKYGFYAKRKAADVYASGKGSAAEINLLLVACLRAAGMQADPVILGTRNHSRPHPIYPNSDRFNYVVAVVDIAGKTLFADATNKDLPFGYLPEQCLHAEGWRVSKNAAGFIPMQAGASGYRTIYTDLKFDGGGWKGNVSVISKGYKALETVYKMNTMGKDAYLTAIQTGFADWSADRPQAIFLDTSENVRIDIPINIATEDADIVYFKQPFDPPFSDQYFADETRTWPMDFPYKSGFNYVLTIPIPEGYQISEVPEDAAVALNENNDLHFKYNSSIAPGHVTIVSRFQMKRTLFLAEEYEGMRMFFNLMEQKNREMIVFKKIQ